MRISYQLPTQTKPNFLNFPLADSITQKLSDSRKGRYKGIAVSEIINGDIRKSGMRFGERKKGKN